MTTQPSIIQAPDTNQWVSDSPASWQIAREQLTERDVLLNQLNQYTVDSPEGHYWVLLQGRMNEKSQRQSLLNLDSATALVAALDAYFQQSDHKQATIMLLPGWQATGMLFTRHPLRRDLHHWVVEGVNGERADTQRLIFSPEGRLVFAADNSRPLLDVVPKDAFLELVDRTKKMNDAPQAVEWVFDGRKLWVLQTLTIGSLPAPQDAWTCRANDGFWYQAITPLWYTLEGRWLKNRFWEPMVRRHKLSQLHKVEPYKRQYSHIYRNAQFLQQLPQFSEDIPPGWSANNVNQQSPLMLGWQQLQIAGRTRKFKKRFDKAIKEKGAWPRFKQLDLLGEELAEIIAPLYYAPTYSAPAQCIPDSVKEWFTTGDSDALRVGVDPVHRLLASSPPEKNSLPILAEILPESRLTQLFPAAENRTDKQLNDATKLRNGLALHIQTTLNEIANNLISNKLLTQPDDIYFCYYDELWLLCEKQQVPPSLSLEKLNQRKVRYLEDAHRGAPHWQLDGLGFGFSQDNQPHELLLGKTAVSGCAEGRIKRLVSGWTLNQIQPGDILVMHRCDPHWLPWLTQAAALVISADNEQDHAIRLAKALDIPCIYALSDAVHCLTDGQTVSLDADKGEVKAV